MDPLQISEIAEKLDFITDEFNSKIQTEFQQIRLLEVNPTEVGIKSLSVLQDRVNALTNKIRNDNWIIEIIESTDIYKFITNVEIIIRKKADYLRADKDLFITEFKWFQFNNALSETDKTIINQLKSKRNWKKSFLIYYLNSLLVNSANLDLPTNDDEHKELDKTLKILEIAQLKYIKEFWFSKQIDTKRRFEQKNVNLSVENLYNKRSSNRFKRISLRQIVQYDANLFTNFFPVIFTSPDVASNLFKGVIKCHYPTRVIVLCLCRYL